jgi:hypothetical protein
VERGELEGCGATVYRDVRPGHRMTGPVAMPDDFGVVFLVVERPGGRVGAA